MYDAARFLVTNRPIIERAPLQIYGGALAFSPAKSVIRGLFWDQRLPLLQDAAGVEEEWDSCLQVLEGHTETVTYAVFSGDGGLLASVSVDKTVRLWDTHTGVCKHLFEGYKGFYGALSISRRGTMLAFPGPDGAVHIRDCETGRLLSSCGHNTGLFSALALSWDGNTLVAGLLDGTVHIWDITSGVSEVVTVAKTSIHTVILNFDADTLAFGCVDGAVQVYEVSSRTQLHTFACGPFPVIRFDDDGTLVAISIFGVVTVWDLGTGVCHNTWGDWDVGPLKVDYSPASKLVAVARDATTEIWDAITGKATSLGFYGHGRDVYYTSFSPDGQVLATCSQDQTIRLWDTGMPRSGSNQQTTWDPITCLAFSPDGKTFASGSMYGEVKAWNAKTGEVREKVEPRSSGGGPIVLSVAFSADGKDLAWTAYRGTYTCIYSLSPTTRRWELDTPGAYTISVLFSKDGDLLRADGRHRRITWFKSRADPIEPISRAECTLDYILHEGLYVDLDTPLPPAHDSPPRFLRKDGKHYAMDWGHLLPLPEAIRKRWAERLFVRGEWVTQAGKNVLWLPPSYRPNCTALHDSLLILGQKSGSVTRLTLKSTQG